MNGNRREPSLRNVVAGVRNAGRVAVVDDKYQDEEATFSNTSKRGVRCQHVLGRSRTAQPSLNTSFFEPMNEVVADMSALFQTCNLLKNCQNSPLLTNYRGCETLTSLRVNAVVDYRASMQLTTQTEKTKTATEVKETNTHRGRPAQQLGAESEIEGIEDSDGGEGATLGRRRSAHRHAVNSEIEGRSEGQAHAARRFLLQQHQMWLYVVELVICRERGATGSTFIPIRCEETSHVWNSLQNTCDIIGGRRVHFCRGGRSHHFSRFQARAKLLCRYVVNKRARDCRFQARATLLCGICCHAVYVLTTSLQ